MTVSRKARETGLEPATSAVTGRCSNQLNYSRKKYIGRNRTRTYDHLCVRQALYQLSYTPDEEGRVYKSQGNIHKAKVKTAAQEIFKNLMLKSRLNLSVKSSCDRFRLMTMTENPADVAYVKEQIAAKNAKILLLTAGFGEGHNAAARRHENGP